MLKEILEKLGEGKLKKYVYIFHPKKGDEYSFTTKDVRDALWKAKLPIDVGSYKVPGGYEIYVDSKNPIDYESLTRKLQKLGIDGYLTPVGGNPGGK